MSETLLTKARETAKKSLDGKPELWRELSQGQSPHTLLIACSDSRVDMRRLFGLAPGELFVIRNAGQIIAAHGAGDWGNAGTIEYAMSVLKVQHVVVCGHSKCGAVGAALDPASVESLPAVAEWVNQSGTSFPDSVTAIEDATDRVDAAVAVHVQQQIENLKTHPSVREAMDGRGVDIVGWVYQFDRGLVATTDEIIGSAGAAVV